jgi:hypothetical protein
MLLIGHLLRMRSGQGKMALKMTIHDSVGQAAHRRVAAGAGHIEPIDGDL